MVSGFWRKSRKALRALRHGRTRAGLAMGVAPAYEHSALLAGLGPLDLIVDVGANRGQFALIARLTQPQARVIAFEPLPDAAARFAALFQGDDMVTLHHSALGAQAGQAQIHITARADSSSLLAPMRQSEIFAGTHQVATDQVPVTRLDHMLQPKDIAQASLLKIDVQGFEGTVLQGARALLARFQWIYCEMSFIELYQGQDLAPDLIAWLAQQGFRLESVLVDHMVAPLGRAVQADFLFRNTAQGTA